MSIRYLEIIYDGSNYDLVSGDIVQIGQVGVVENHLRKRSNHHLDFLIFFINQHNTSYQLPPSTSTEFNVPTFPVRFAPRGIPTATSSRSPSPLNSPGFSFWCIHPLPRHLICTFARPSNNQIIFTSCCWIAKVGVIVLGAALLSHQLISPSVEVEREGLTWGFPLAWLNGVNLPLPVPRAHRPDKQLFSFTGNRGSQSGLARALPVVAELSCPAWCIL